MSFSKHSLARRSLLVGILLLVICLFSGCWDKQDHEVIAPETPVFSLFGNITEMYSNEPLSEIQIECVIYELLFEWELDEPIVYTDSSGYFEYQLTPGNYILYFYRDNRQIAQQNISMPYAPRQFDYALPRVLTTQKRYKQTPILGATGLKSQELAIIQEWQPDSATVVPRILRGNFDFGFYYTGIDKFVRRNPDFLGLTYFRNNYWASGGTFTKPVLYQIDPDSGKVIREYKIPHRIADLTADGNFIWGTATNDSIYRFQISDHLTVDSFSPEIPSLSGISFSVENFWLFSRKTNYLYQLTNEFVPFQAYKLFFKNEADLLLPVEDIHFLAFTEKTDLFLIRGETSFRLSLPQ